jgi:hypothetical protein
MSLFLQVIVVFGLLEFFLPFTVREQALSYLFNGSIPVAYISRDISLFSEMNYRIGSIILSPLTFSFSCVALLALNPQESRVLIHRYFIYLICILTQVKTSLLGLVLLLFKKQIGKFSYLAFFTLVFSAFLFSYWFTPEEVYLTSVDSSLKSISNHLIGLTAGLRGSLSNYFTGHGLGKSGFLIYLEVKESSTVSPFKDSLPGMNGNESSIGVIGYQLGLFFLCLHFYLYFTFIKVMRDSRSHLAISFCFFFIAFQMLSESALTMFISILSALIFAKFIKESN